MEVKNYQVATKYTLQDPLKFTQIGIFGLKINHLATQPLTSKPNRGQSLFWSQSYDF
jgi:hypothetical protein